MAKKKTKRKAKPRAKASVKKHSPATVDSNVMATLAYALGWFSGILVYLLKEDDKFVRFHAMQSIIVFGGLTLVTIVPFFGWIVAVPLSLIGVVLWVVLMIKAYSGEKYKLPIAGDLAEKYA